MTFDSRSNAHFIVTTQFVTTLYIVAAISLTGMQPYNEISSTTGYASAFIYNDQVWAANICAYGQLICLPVVSLITVMAQPRLQLAMAENGLFPSRFGEIDDSGNLTNGIMLCGSAMVLIASFVPFTVIDDTISSAVLVVYSMTDSSLLLLRLSSPDSSPRLLKKLILTFNGGASGSKKTEESFNMITEQQSMALSQKKEHAYHSGCDKGLLSNEDKHAVSLETKVGFLDTVPEYM